MFEEVEDWYYFGGMVAQDPNDIYEILVEDDDEEVRSAIPSELLDEFDLSGNGSKVYDYIAMFAKPVYIKKGF